jgi:pimeloyl-ACP methyl ester carboxylesterase
LRFALIGSAAGLGLALIVGAVYEQFARKAAEAQFPPPGKMVDIGGRRLHLDCAGAGSPTVLLEAGLDPRGSLGWIKVREPVAAFTRVCVYDRAGIMWSDPASGARSSAEIAEDLERLVTAAPIDGPLLLVGHSIGGPYALTFAKRMRERVVGLVLVDASHPKQQAKLQAVFPEPWLERTFQRVFMHAGWTGVPRLMWGSSGEDPAALAYQPRAMASAAAEIEALDDTLRIADDAHALGALPLIVLTAQAPRSPETLRAIGMSAEQDARGRAVWLELQRDEATWSSASRQAIFEDADHYIQLTKPEAVIEAIRELVEQARTGG